MSKNIRKRREKLWIEMDGKCHWCGTNTILPPRGSTKIEHRDNLATLDHLRTRLDDNRLQPNDSNEERTTLACWACNNRRGILSQIAHEEVTIQTDKCRCIMHEDIGNGTIP